MEAIKEEPIFSPVTTIDAGAITPRPEISLSLPSIDALVVTYGIDPMFRQFYGPPSNFLPELSTHYALLSSCWNRLRDRLLPASHKKPIEAFVNSADFRSLAQITDTEEASDEDAEKVVKTIICSHTLQQNISVQILAEVFMEIIRELKPSKAALHFARISMRNSLTFVPSAKEFRDALIRSINSLATLENMLLSLQSEKRNNDDDDARKLSCNTEAAP